MSQWLLFVALCVVCVALLALSYAVRFLLREIAELRAALGRVCTLSELGYLDAQKAMLGYVHALQTMPASLRLETMQAVVEGLRRTGQALGISEASTKAAIDQLPREFSLPVVEPGPHPASTYDKKVLPS